MFSSLLSERVFFSSLLEEEFSPKKKWFFIYKWKKYYNILNNSFIFRNQNKLLSKKISVIYLNLLLSWAERMGKSQLPLEETKGLIATGFGQYPVFHSHLPIPFALLSPPPELRNCKIFCEDVLVLANLPTPSHLMAGGEWSGAESLWRTLIVLVVICDFRSQDQKKADAITNILEPFQYSCVYVCVCFFFALVYCQCMYKVFICVCVFTRDEKGRTSISKRKG